MTAPATYRNPDGSVCAGGDACTGVCRKDATVEDATVPACWACHSTTAELREWDGGWQCVAEQPCVERQEQQLRRARRAPVHYDEQRVALDARIAFADAVQIATDREYADVKASARKTGRNPRYPFVPVLVYSTGGVRGTGRTEQILGAAYATRAAAVDCAERALFDRRVAFTRQLTDPTKRALRESRGLPREIGELR